MPHYPVLSLLLIPLFIVFYTHSFSFSFSFLSVGFALCPSDQTELRLQGQLSPFPGNVQLRFDGALEEQSLLTSQNLFLGSIASDHSSCYSLCISMDSSFSISLSHTYFHLIHFSILRTPLSVSETYELSLFLGDALFIFLRTCLKPSIN